MKQLLALMLGRDAVGYLDVQRSAHLQRMRELTEKKRTGDGADLPEDFGGSILLREPENADGQHGVEADERTGKSDMKNAHSPAGHE